MAGLLLIEPAGRRGLGVIHHDANRAGGPSTVTSGVLRLGDGRSLGYREVGAPDGLPVLYCHGTPSSSAESRLFGTPDEISARGLRLIAPDRPGSGRSSYQRGRQILDWPSDAAALLDHLGLPRVAVLGYSGGSPYALACALRLPGRVTTVVTVSGACPFEVPGVTDGIAADSLRFMRLAPTRPLVSRAAAWAMGLTARLAPARLTAQARRALPAPDVAALDDEQIAAAFAQMVHETTHGSPQGAQRDTALMVSPWGFDPAAVTVPVRLWHGTEDRNAPAPMAAYLASRLPSADLTWLEGEGHISAAASHRDRILVDLVSRARAAS